jgi:hypothetical protein
MTSADDRDDRFEAVANFLSRIDAEIARGALESECIEAIVSPDDAGGMRPHMWMGGVRLLVRTADIARANEILREAEQAE